MGENDLLTRCSRCSRHERSPLVESWRCNLCTSRDYSSHASQISVLNCQNDKFKTSSEIDAEQGKEELKKIDGWRKSHLKELCEFKSRFGSLLSSGILSDLTIEIEGHIIKAHKCILAGR